MLLCHSHDGGVSFLLPYEHPKDDPEATHHKTLQVMQLGFVEDQTLQAIEKVWQYNSIENEELGASLYLVLVPENMAQRIKDLRSLADSGVHLNRCATVVLHNVAKVLKIGHHLYRVIIRK